MTALRARALSAEWPFPGLRPFDFADSEFLFGRNDQKYALYRMLDRSRFVAVVGSSGSGKSSLVFAALLPLLRDENEEDRNKRRGERAWIWTKLRPGRTPLQNLTDALAGLSAEADDEIARARRERISYYLRRSSYGIVEALAEMTGIGAARPVIVVDQFEELFRFAGSHEGSVNDPEGRARSLNEAEQFVQLLIQASRSSECKVHVLITMRSDFIGDCARFEGLPESVSAVQFLVPALSRIQREDVVCKPLLKSHSSIEPELVKSLLNDSNGELDQLPVLQHCLLRMWEKAAPVPPADHATVPSDNAGESPQAFVTPRRLVMAHYEAVGGMSGALSQHANEILAELPGLERAVEKTFRALAEIDREGRAIRRSRLFIQLKDETGVADADLRLMLDRFRSDDCSFLAPSSSAQKELTNDTSIDVSHEALLRRWERVCGKPGATGVAGKGWLRAEEEDGQHYRHLLLTKKLYAKDAKEEWNWWKALSPTSAWAKRYGGEYERVEGMLRRSWNSRNFGIGVKVTAAAAVAAALVLGLVSYEGYSVERRAQAEQMNLLQQQASLQEKAATDSYLMAVKSGRILMDAVQDALDRGAIPLASARGLLQVAEDIASQVKGVRETPEITEDRGELLVMTSDNYSDLDDTPNALKYAQMAKGLADGLLGLDSAKQSWQLLLYRALFRIGDAEDLLGHNTVASQNYRNALAIVEPLFKAAPDDPELGDNVAFIYGKLGDISFEHNKYEDANQNYGAAVTILEALVAKYPDNPGCVRDLATSYFNLASLLRAQNRETEALAMHRKALAIRQSLLAKQPYNTTYLSHAAVSLVAIGKLLVQLSQPDEAIADFREAVAHRRTATEVDSTNLVLQAALANTLEQLGGALQKTGSAEAMENYDSALKIRQRLAAADPENPKWQKSLENLTKKIGTPVPN